MSCPSDNTISEDQSRFWGPSGINWDAHRIGWVIAGATAAATVILTLISVLRHAFNYRNRAEQRQIIRILYMPSVFAVVSFFSYRFFRSYTYYSLVEVVYESITLSAFLFLLIQYVASTGEDRTAKTALARKDKRALPLPFCCFRFRATKPAFMYVLKWMVLQYTIIRPAISVAGIVTEYYKVYCVDSWSYKYANVYLTAVDFASISIALYGLILFYTLTHDELKGRKPLAKFLTIKLIVMATFYQSFIFNLLQNHGVIKGTEFWTPTNIADGLNALTLCIEMVFFAVAMMWVYSPSEYGEHTGPKLSAWRAIFDSLNLADFFYEIWLSWKFFFDYLRGKPYTSSRRQELEKGHVDFDSAFGLDSAYDSPPRDERHSPYPYGGPQNQGYTQQRDRYVQSKQPQEQYQMQQPQSYVDVYNQHNQPQQVVDPNSYGQPYGDEHEHEPDPRHLRHSAIGKAY